MLEYYFNSGNPNNHVKFVGSQYPVPPLRLAASQFCTLSFMGLLATAFLGERMFPDIINGPPSNNDHLLIHAFRYIVSNKGSVIAGGFLLNTIGGSISQTGAFEVYVNDELVYSKLERGTAPTPQQMKDLIEAALKKQDK